MQLKKTKCSSFHNKTFQIYPGHFFAFLRNKRKSSKDEKHFDGKSYKIPPLYKILNRIICIVRCLHYLKIVMKLGYTKCSYLHYKAYKHILDEFYSYLDYSKMMFVDFNQVYYWGFKSDTHNNYKCIIRNKWS